MTARATWNGAVIAESDETVIVEGNHYFPPDAVDGDLLRASGTHTHCPWKGEASYYSLDVDGSVNLDAAWYYSAPFDAAAEIRDYVAFWRGVDVTADAGDGRIGPMPPAALISTTHALAGWGRSTSMDASGS